MPQDLPDWTNPAASTLVKLGNLVVPKGTEGASLEATPPASATGLLLVIAPVATATAVLVVTGGVTNYTGYSPADFIGAGEGGPIAFGIPADADAPYGVVLAYSGVLSSLQDVTVGYVYAYIGQGFQLVGANALSPLPVIPGLEMVPIGPNGAAWPMLPLPPQHVAVFTGARAGASPVQLIAPTTGQAIRLRRMTFNASSGVAVDYIWESTTTHLMAHACNMTTAVQQEGSVAWEGLALPVGEGLQLASAQGSNGPYLDGSITYDLY